MTQVQSILIQLIHEEVGKDGQFAATIIEHATIAVKQFANKQADYSAHYGVILTNLIEKVSNTNPELLDNVANFDKNQILALVKRHYDGTPFWEELSKKMNYSKPNSYGGILSNEPVK